MSLIVFSPTFALPASLLQRHLEKRKDRRVAAQRSHAGDPRWRGALVVGGGAPIKYERRGAAALLTIDRPERRNAVDGPTAEAL